MPGDRTLQANATTSATPPNPKNPQRRHRAPMSALGSWVLFDWAAQPFYTLILTFLFAPYFANSVVGDAVLGQTLWGYAMAVAGIVIAIGGPVFGAMADHQGARKPWIALFSLGLIVAMSCLWFAEPNASTQTILLVLLAFIIAAATAEFATLFSNAIMPSLVGRDEIGRFSGIGWATGYAGGLISLVLMAGFIVGDSATGQTILGLEPFIALDHAAHEGDRLVGPFSALWFALFVIPFFLFVPDTTVSDIEKDARRKGPFADLWDTLSTLPSFPDMLYFLAARMLYSDGLAAIFAFGGIYGAAVFGWGAFELGLFGISLTLAGIVGALIGGFINDHYGSRNVISVALGLLIIAVLGILSVDDTHVLYFWDVVAKTAGSAAFSSTGEHVFMAFAVLVGLVAAPIQSASRVLLAQLAPEDKRTQFFGLFAFSGKITAFLAPFLVATVTVTTDSQRLGMATIVLFLVAGIALLSKVGASAGINAGNGGHQ